MRLILLFLFCAFTACGQFTDFYVDAAVGSSNIYSGSTASTTPTYITLSGDWVQSTRVFTPNDGSTPAASIGGGTNAWAAISVTATPTTPTVFVAAIDSVAAGVNGAITLSANSKSGTSPADSSGAHTMTLVVGGCWKGPNGASGFPWGFVTATLTNESSVTTPFVNFKTGTYSVSAAITHNIAGPVCFGGYGTTPRDRSSRATIDGGANAIILFANTAADADFHDFIFSNNGASGANNLVNVSASSGNRFFRCAFANSQKNGLNGGAYAEQCEAYNCNIGNVAAGAGFNSVGTCVRCLSYSNNVAANGNGFTISTAQSAIDCISAFNSRSGFLLAGAQASFLYGCGAYSNGLHGVEANANALGNIENCNLFKNGKAGITNSAAATAQQKPATIQNCVFGSGSMTNAGGNLPAIVGVQTNGNVLYASGQTPWSSPDTGDFRIINTASKAAGYGKYTASFSGWSSTVAYPDLGAAQSPSTNSAVSGGSWTFSQ